MTEPKVAVVLQQNRGADLLTGSLFWCSFILKSLKSKILVIFSLTCLAPQCTDVESTRPRRYAGPPTSLQRLAGRATERLPSWRKALSDFGPRNRTWRWPRSAPTLQYKGRAAHYKEMWQNPIWDSHRFGCSPRSVTHLHHSCWVRCHCRPRQELPARCGGSHWMEECGGRESETQKNRETVLHYPNQRKVLTHTI